jgi:hypothetical protein
MQVAQDALSEKEKKGNLLFVNSIYYAVTTFRDTKCRSRSSAAGGGAVVR